MRRYDVPANLPGEYTPFFDVESENAPMVDLALWRNLLYPGEAYWARKIVTFLDLSLM